MSSSTQIPIPSTEPGGTWWDVGVPEVSDRPEVNAAYAGYVENKKSAESRLMPVKIGISLIAWQNDDLPELTAAFTTEGAMEDAARIGYAGVERGRRMPADTEGLRAYLDRYGVALCGGWCSGNLMVNDLATEREAIREQVEQFAAL